jgi:mono/diheme cytochrome c family protein
MRNVSTFVISLSVLIGFAVLNPSAYAQEDGAAVYKKQKCYKCHGTEAQGSEGQGPQLKGGKFINKNSAEDIKKVILNGREGADKKYKEFKKKMPKFEGKLSDQELDALVQFLKQESQP